MILLYMPIDALCLIRNVVFLLIRVRFRHSAGQSAPAISVDLKASAFDPKDKSLDPIPPEGSKYMPPHQFTDFKWKDYCPVVFRY